MSADADLYSIIITSHNYGRFLENAIESVLSQDDEHFEVIVIDDGSEDETASIACSYGEQIRYFPQGHAGAFDAALAGVRQASGSRLVFVDADDRCSHMRCVISEQPPPSTLTRLLSSAGSPIQTSPGRKRSLNLRSIFPAPRSKTSRDSVVGD